MDQADDAPLGEFPHGVGPEIFRDRLAQLAADAREHGGEIRLEDVTVALDDIARVEPDSEGHRSRVSLRSGLVIGGLTGAAIVAALATIRYRRRRRA